MSQRWSLRQSLESRGEVQLDQPGLVGPGQSLQDREELRTLHVRWAVSASTRNLRTAAPYSSAEDRRSISQSLDAPARCDERSRTRRRCVMLVAQASFGQLQRLAFRLGTPAAVARSVRIRRACRAHQVFG